ncbi:GH92 family glycosyl hydrolase [Granulicella tundricola]|uniref:Alpha-1,2-mannosidase n=1 Tax=Granulicella tundricola (strain ATCC BAA-1859 / DSM 23138 / MP5ACTX9) TaxID=1198114 RepID=E8WYV5_GRATM|nr:GH92 family glycosyl hydrolase [Granulicella tundricola]ADW68791.1 alpha-1,2-mannosidase [Granulicella tundricola MP5ACTX9]
MRILLLVPLLALLSSDLQGTAQTQPAQWVNERIGTANEGQTFPATGPPFAMTQWTPQTRDGNVKCVAPYYDKDTRIQGFRGSHFLSGSCTQDYGSMTIMPLTGPLKLDAVERASGFDRASEVLTPYRYAVTLRDYNIDAEVTGTTRAGILNFKFNNPGKSWILVQANTSPGDGKIQIDPTRGEILATIPARRLYAGNGQPAGFSGYSVVQFDHPFHTGGTWAGKDAHAGAIEQDGKPGTPGAYVSFDLKPGESVKVKVGTSFTSLDEARKNLQAEIPDWNFAEVAAHAQKDWNTALGRIAVKDETARKRIFYTALYHSMLLPRTFSDVDGSYPSFAGGSRVETAKDFVYYTDYSLWDTFRAVHPMLTILDPAREVDMVKSLIAMGQQGGFLPIFPAWNSYTSEMVGDHAVTVIGDAYLKGLRGFDIEAAYQLMKKNALETPKDHAEYLDGKGRRALESYLKYGYIPLEDKVPDAFHKQEQVSRTLEYAYDDFVVAEVAQSLDHQQDADLFHHRAQNYRNVIDPQTGFARGRHADGTWDTPFDPAVKYPYITEGLPYQYTFFVPQDLPGLITLVGGNEAFIRKLDALFAGNYYDHGNEPSHHIAYLYDNAGAAWKTQQHVRSIMESQYSDAPAGLAGNDDSGQMSAWYVMSALGFYPVTPGVPVYQIGSPLFDDATIHLPSGKLFQIHAAGASSGRQYIQSATLNGTPLNRSWIKHSEVVAGGNLVFEMSSHPNPDWPRP